MHWMQEKKILKKYDMFLRTKYFIVIEGYNPRIHALYLCPQLFRHDSDKLVPLEGEEIGELIARSVEAGAPSVVPGTTQWSHCHRNHYSTAPWKCVREGSLCRSAARRCWASLASLRKPLDSGTGKGLP